MKWVQRPIMKPLKEEDESKYSCYTKTGRKEPTGLTQWINQEYGNKNSNWTRECDCIIRSQLNRSGKFELT
ncbi:photosystem II protein D2 [Iris pallida]|uniref:Photosystem II protein D2 (Plastid) n=1 Tax=Iris pallida TaxID=29817 RepID=A0AAX6HBJ4_IRIPA|nr:photosystem II protein D2 [Iris pallida]KAJ6838112.1 photosystem II protein D2 [Iris pallida]